MNIPSVQLLSNIHVLQNVPINSSYKDQLTFNTIGEQTTYFLNKSKYTFANCSPVRMQNALRLPVCADYIYDCNYVMFQNANFTNKWFYAFINQIEFVNVNECLVYVEMDVWQTWLFDMDIKQCMVEREHVNDDTIGANTYPEGLEHGEYIIDALNPIPYRDEQGEVVDIIANLSIVFQTTFDESLQDAQGAFYARTYSGLTYIYFKNATDANAFIENATKENKADGIINIFMLPDAFIAEPNEDPKHYTASIQKFFYFANGYVPKNNKLFTWPYYFMYVTNNNGISAELHFEDWYGDNCTFNIYGDMSSNPTMMLVPTNYKYGSFMFNDYPNWNEKIVLNGWPICAWTNDATQAWIAQERGSLIASGVTTLTSAAASIIGNTAGGIAGGASSMGVPGAILGGIGGLASSTLNAGVDVFNKAVTLVGAYYDHESKPPQAHGTQGGSIGLATGTQGFYHATMKIKNEYAQKIDDFFTRFGYKVMELKTPNITGRPYFNYVKTVDSTVTGNISFEDKAQIQSILDNGITLWHVNNGVVDVGNYSVDNSPQ